MWWGPFFSKGVQIFRAQVEVFVPGDPNGGVQIRRDRTLVLACLALCHTLIAVCKLQRLDDALAVYGLVPRRTTLCGSVGSNS